VRGPANAPVTIVEFADFECPFSKQAQEPLAKVLERYHSAVRLVYRHRIGANHGQAEKAAEALHCAADQNKGWEYPLFVGSRGGVFAGIAA
ncbi:MAG: thioredoxin domain-containing protein, partial [Actinobacteria bacterium]|nr:thioredoxin domain-containing protein [Actinomycetota bacterium]